MRPIHAHKLPAWAPMGGFQLAHHVWVKDHDREFRLIHELVHVDQFERDGWRFHLRWLLSARWRVRYESEACAALVRTGRFDAANLAKTLASWLYLWPTSEWLAEAAIRRWL